MPNGLPANVQAWANAWKEGVKAGKSGTECITAAKKARAAAEQKSAVNKVSPAVAAAVVSAPGIATQIPQVYIDAFATSGAAAASTLPLWATVAAALGAFGTGYGVGTLATQAGAKLSELLLKSKTVQEALFPTVKLSPHAEEVLASLTQPWTPTPSPIADPVTAVDLSAASWSVATPEGAAAFKAALVQGKSGAEALEAARVAAVKPAVVPTPAPAPAPAPVTVTYITPAPYPAPAPTPAPVVQVVQAPAPVVNVNVPPVPTPLPITGPLTAAGLAAIIPALATSIGTEGHQAGLRCMGTTGSILLQNLLKALIPAGIAAGFMFSPQLQSAITGAAQKFVEAIYSPLTREAPITPEKAPGIGAVLLSQAVLFGSGAHLMSIMAEASAPLKHMGIGYLAAFMADAAGFSRIAAAYQGMMIQWGLQQPMRYWALQHFRPMIPREGDLLRLLGEYAITREEYNRYMPYHGYDSWWIDKLYELADRPFSPMLFRFLAEAGELDPELLDRELKNASYNIKSIPSLKGAFTRLALGELKGAFSGAATKRFRLGYGGEGELRDNLGDLGYSGVQLEKATRAARMDRATELAEDTKKLYLDQFTKGHIEDYDLRLRLAGLGLEPETVSVEVARAVLKRKPKPEPKVDPKIEKATRELQAKYVTYYTELYRKDQITEAEFYRYLVTLGIGPELASVTVGIESARKIPKPKS